MRVLVAPDRFGAALTAAHAAEAIAEGWARTAPRDELIRVPMGDGGVGFMAALHAALGGTLQAVTVRGPLGDATPASVLHVGRTAYVEAAQAAGAHLMVEPTPWRASSHGVGETILAACAGGARRVVVGLGGLGVNDGGAGLLAALGARADRPLAAGPGGLRGVRTVDLSSVRERLAGIDLVAATDGDLPLLGMFGTTKTHGTQRGLAEEEIVAVDAVLDEFVVACCGSAPAERRVADAPGAGAGGGVGFALALLGAEHAPGAAVVADAVALDDACATADLVVSGEATFDHTSRAGTVVHEVAGRAAAAARPCIALAHEVTVGAREMRAMGVESAYAAGDRVSPAQVSADPRAALAALAERVARTWSPGATG